MSGPNVLFVLVESTGEKVVVAGRPVQVPPRDRWNPSSLMPAKYWACAWPLVEGEKLPSAAFEWTTLRGALGANVDIVLVSVPSAGGSDFSLNIEQPDEQVTLFAAPANALHLAPAAEAS